MTTESLASLEPQVLRSEPPAARPRPRPEPTSDTLRRGASLAATARLSSTERLPSALAALLPVAEEICSWVQSPPSALDPMLMGLAHAALEDLSDRLGAGGCTEDCDVVRCAMDALDVLRRDSRRAAHARAEPPAQALRAEPA